jgi:hypothetical protein
VALEHVVGQAVGDGVVGAHVEVAVDVRRDALHGLAGVVAQDLLHPLPVEPHLPGLDLHVDLLALGAAVGLVDHDPGVGQREALALGAAGQDHRSRRGGHAHAHGGHGRRHVLHGVVDHPHGGDRPAR